MDTAETTITTATARNRSGTVSVRTTEQGLPVDLHIDKSELRYGAAQLAEQIVSLCRRATLEAAALHREELAGRGMPEGLLNRLGLPTHDDVQRARRDDARTAGSPSATGW
ncbi:hypothetical protein ACWDT5_14670 [Rhodococcus aetherivorans]|jgi:hypothetical protein|uniref:YbaB/EbfC DNA-binding family protein n=1 Tax=Rhodococcus aetherivorans TaxID=191292 RepID=A0ABQ0YPR0_9NOCA|nr:MULTISPECIES: hypothetical protein [Rhodococcus]ETT24774.1 hypothetical protein RR21198_4344 [Rhodococcus rhodochrous ATCC 21198]KDE12723.1 hypothetical protein N505_0114895 [Rhodococcus aetherivorans]MBC2588393.1 hypothetical protein [Rhodococcus aetherivorans]MDV6295000.1 hypothetical protein [Rhodococcus aetherivorans]NGP26735.1 hypothetical protein [Rhodococcus aetherivorans]